MKDLVTLRVGLQHSVLDAVVNHLDVVPGAGRSHVRVTIRRRERLEDRLAEPERVVRSTDHQTIAVLESPDAPARPGIDELNSLLAQLGPATHRIVEVRVSSIDYDVALRHSRKQRSDRLIDRIPSGNHDPHNA